MLRTREKQHHSYRVPEERQFHVVIVDQRLVHEADRRTTAQKGPRGHRCAPNCEQNISTSPPIDCENQGQEDLRRGKTIGPQCKD